jgi:hypothetical protein
MNLIYSEFHKKITWLLFFCLWIIFRCFRCLVLAVGIDLACFRSFVPSADSYLAKRRTANHPCPVCGKHYVTSGVPPWDRAAFNISTHVAMQCMPGSVHPWVRWVYTFKYFCSVIQWISHINGYFIFMGQYWSIGYSINNTIQF